ncbi:MAG: cytochrome c [Kordiimonadaceae bacterium]|nr:cytochrome c [Kordiimonadaceae bacterium]MBL4854432.1 cytochrome c [Robiginitomaculum sp.]
MKYMRTISMFLMGSFLLAACSSETPVIGGIKLQPDNSELVAQGKVIYIQDCASCHGANLEGQGDWRIRSPEGLLPAPPHDESGHTWHHPDQMLFDMTKYGVQKFAGPDYESDMPAYEDTLTDEEIVAVLSYIKSQWPENIQKRQDGLNRQYEAIETK